MVALAPQPRTRSYAGDELVETRRDLDRNGSIAAGASTTPQDGVETLYPLQDDLFTVYSVVDGTGTVRERYEYGDYGTPLFLDATGMIRLSGTSDIGQQHLFTGRLWVSLPAGAATHNGLYEYRHRWSNPTLGQFLQRDPLGYVDGMNVYSYGRSSPASRFDPLGGQSIPPNVIDPARLQHGLDEWRKRCHGKGCIGISIPKDFSNPGFARNMCHYFTFPVGCIERQQDWNP